MDSTTTPQNQPTDSAASRLPPELTDAIIDAGKDDKPFLKTCGLLCRSWVPASRRRLFECVTLRRRNVVDFRLLMQSELVTIPRHILRHLEILPSSRRHIWGHARLLSQLAFVKDLLLDSLDFTGHAGLTRTRNRILPIVDTPLHLPLPFRHFQRFGHCFLVVSHAGGSRFGRGLVASRIRVGSCSRLTPIVASPIDLVCLLPRGRNCMAAILAASCSPPFYHFSLRWQDKKSSVPPQHTLENCWPILTKSRH
jgi:hypothetical protein